MKYQSKNQVIEVAQAQGSISATFQGAMTMNIESAKEIIAEADGDECEKYDSLQIDAGEVHKIDSGEPLGDDYYFFDTAFDPEAYGLETDWCSSHKGTVVGPSDGGHRTAVRL